MTREYINGYRETPFAVERQFSDGRTIQAYRSDQITKEALYALLGSMDEKEARG